MIEKITGDAIYDCSEVVITSYSPESGEYQIQMSLIPFIRAVEALGININSVEIEDEEVINKEDEEFLQNLSV